MRRLFLLLAALALVVAACGDDDAFITTTQAGGTTSPTTSEATDTTAAPTTTESPPTTEGETGTVDKEGERRDPAFARSPALSRLSRTEGGGSSTSGTKAADPEDDAPEYGERGSDPLLDILWDDCSAGDMGACDELYRQSPIDSEYEDFGDTCGGTTEGGTWCETEIDVTDPYLYGVYDECSDGDMAACDTLYLESPVGSHFEWFGYTCGLVSDGSTWCIDLIPDEPTDRLDDLYAACEAGDMQACDDLYLEAPVGSEYEDFGFTCGNRTDGSRWCVDEIPTGDIDDYGDDPYLDGLWDDCAAGDMAACDALYLESPIDSRYEEFGYTCGDLTDGSMWCVDVGSGVGQPFGYGDDPYFDGLWDDCEAGDMQACDDLYSESPVGSDYEWFGDTCGSRTAGGVWCVDIDPGTTDSACGDPTLDAYYWACASGDWQACDDLYWESPIDSYCEEFGDTCGYTTDGSMLCVDYSGSGGTDSVCGDPVLDNLYDACAVGDWQACDDLYLESPIGSYCEEYGNTCAFTTDGSMWCVDYYGG